VIFVAVLVILVIMNVHDAKEESRQKQKI